MSKHLWPIAICAALCGCDAGNYSNEDIDFQLAVPQRQDIAVRLPAQALESNDSAEYYRNTRKTVRDLNNAADAFVSLIDHVRATAPSERHPDRRVWGPFPVIENPLFLARVVINRINQPGTPLRFSYSFEFRARADAADRWQVLISGEFIPAGDARHGTGLVHFSSAAARAAGYPLGGLVGIDDLTIDYKTDGFPMTIRIGLTTFPELKMATYEHTEQQDGSGSIHFVYPTPGVLGVDALDTTSRWLGSGAGRADVRVSAGNPLVLNKSGTDCWGIDGRATYVHRDWNMAAELGAESTCVFPAP